MFFCDQGHACEDLKKQKTEICTDCSNMEIVKFGCKVCSDQNFCKTCRSKNENKQQFYSRVMTKTEFEDKDI